MPPINPISRSAATSGIGAGLNVVGNYINTRIAEASQKRLLANQYDQFFANSQKAGATPAAIAQGLTGSGPASTPSVGSVGSTPDIAANTISARDVESQAGRRDIENRVDLMRLTYEPQKYFADIRKTFSEIDLNKGMNKHYKSLANLNDEIRHNYVVMRPWQIAKFSAEITKLGAEYGLIIEQTNTQKSIQRYYDSSAYKNWNEGYNASLQSFGIMFDNSLRAAGINPNLEPWDALKQLAMTDPSNFRIVLDNIADSARRLDAKIASNIGEHYKRNIAIGAGLYGMSKLIGNKKDKTLGRLNMLTGAIGNMIPFARPAALPFGMGSISAMPYISSY